MSLQIRRREPVDVPAVVDLLLRQQPLTRYPFRDPLPFPPEDFVVRRGQLAAWVAVLDDHVVGHVGAVTVEEGVSARIWGEATDQPAGSLVEVATLVVDADARGLGVGAALMDTVERHLRASDLAPVLEVMSVHAAAHALYVSRGWAQVGTTRFDWLPEDEPSVRLMVLPG